MVDLDVGKLIFSSSAAVYGAVPSGLVREDAPLRPLNPYGTSKLMCEHVSDDFMNTVLRKALASALDPIPPTEKDR